MGTLGQAFGMEVLTPRIRIFFEALQDLPFEAVEFGAAECVRLELSFPVPARVREYARGYRRKFVPDLSQPAIPEGFMTDEVARQKMAELRRLLGVERLQFADGGVC